MVKYNHIIITGANGFIGSELLKHFCKTSYKVTALVNRMPNEKIKGVAYEIFKLDETFDLNCFTPDSILIHCAYSKEKPKPNSLDKNIIGTKELVMEAAKKGVRKKIFLSSLSARPESSSYYGAQKQVLELLFYGEKDAVLRPGFVVGKGGLFQNTMNSIQKSKLLPLIAGGKQPIYYIGISDLVKSVDYIIENDLNGLFYVSNKEPVSFYEFYSGSAKAFGIKFKSLYIPVWLIKTAVFFNSFLQKPFITSDNLKGMEETATIKQDELVNRFPFGFQSLKQILSDIKW